MANEASNQADLEKWLRWAGWTALAAITLFDVNATFGPHLGFDGFGL